MEKNNNDKAPAVVDEDELVAQREYIVQNLVLEDEEDDKKAEEKALRSEDDVAGAVTVPATGAPSELQRLENKLIENSGRPGVSEGNSESDLRQLERKLIDNYCPAQKKNGRDTAPAIQRLENKLVAESSEAPGTESLESLEEKLRESAVAVSGIDILESLENKVRGSQPQQNVRPTSIPGAFASGPTQSATCELEQLQREIADSAQGTSKDSNEEHANVVAAEQEECLVKAKPVHDGDRTKNVLGAATPEDAAEELRRRQQKEDQIRSFIARLLGALLFVAAAIVVIVIILVVTKDDGKKEDTNTRAPTLVPTDEATPAPTPFIVNLPDFTLIAVKEDPDSPQAQAYQWLRNDPNITAYSESKGIQRMALVTFCYATAGEDWNLKSNWLSYDIDECSWQNKANLTGGEDPFDFGEVIVTSSVAGGSVCDMDGNMLELVLTANGLAGVLPKEISLLTSLRRLDIAKNEVGGTIPSEIGAMSSLQELVINENKLTGALPSEIGLLASLEIFICTRMDITGTLSTEIGSMASMREFQILATQVTGSIPKEIYNMQNLTYLGTFL